MNLFLCLLFQGVLLYETLAWEVKMPKEIHGLSGSCLVIPCSFSYTSYPPRNPNRVVWYQWASFSYPLVYDPQHKGDVIGKFKEKTELFGDPSRWECSLVIKDLDLSHHGERLYAWIDPDNVGKSTYKFYDVTSTIRVDTDLKLPTIHIYGGERMGHTMTVACQTFHSCPYSKPVITLNGVEGSDQPEDVHVKNGLWKRTLTRTGVVKAESSDIECTVTYYGRILTKARKNKKAACDYYNITIEPEAADVTEGVAKDFICTIYHSCQKDLPTISWNYKNMQVTMGNKRFTGSDSASFSNITFLGTKQDNRKKLTCTAEFSGKKIEESVDLRVQQYGSKLVNPNINTGDLLHEADVSPRLTALPRSCVVIPCSFNMEEEHAVQLSLRWVTKKGYMFHTGQSNVLDNFKGRTRLLGNLDMKNCTVEIDNIQNHDNGPFCFQAERNQEKYMFNNSCVFIVMQAIPKKPVMSSLPDDIKPGTRVTVTCSVNHTCPTHPPSITWNIPTARESVWHQNLGRGVWESVSMVIFIPTGYEEQEEVICRAKFWGKKAPEAVSSAKLSVAEIQGDWTAAYVIAPALVILLLCAGVIIYKRRRRGELWAKRVNDTRFNNDI